MSEKSIVQPKKSPIFSLSASKETAYIEFLSNPSSRTLGLLRPVDTEDAKKEVFENNWGKFECKLERTKNLLGEIVNNYGKDILSSIEEFTKIPWDRNVVNIYVSLNENENKVLNNDIFMARIPEDCKVPYALTLIHEIVHANTGFRYQSLGLKLPTSSNEVSHEILADKVKQYIEEKYSIKLGNEFDIKLDGKEYIKNETSWKELLEISKNFKDFDDLVRKVDGHIFENHYDWYMYDIELPRLESMF